MQKWDDYGFRLTRRRRPTGSGEQAFVVPTNNATEAGQGRVTFTRLLGFTRYPDAREYVKLETLGASTGLGRFG